MPPCVIFTFPFKWMKRGEIDGVIPLPKVAGKAMLQACLWL